MSIIKLIAIVSLAVAVLTMVTSNQLSIYASPTTEDDGWVEGDDDSQGEISSQEELEEAYEGTQWEDDIGSNEFEDAADNGNEDDTENQDKRHKYVQMDPKYRPMRNVHHRLKNHLQYVMGASKIV